MNSAAAIVCAVVTVASAFGQEGVSIRPEGDTVVISSPEQIELQVLVDYVGKILDVHFVYSDELQNQRVELRPTPVEIPKSHLLNLLVSLLRVRDLAIVEEGEGFYRIVRTEAAARTVASVVPAGVELSPDSMRMVTQVLSVPSGRVQDLSEKLSAFLSSAKGSLVTLPERGLIVVTDYEFRIKMLQDLIQLLDTAVASVEVRRFPVVGADTVALAAQVSGILSETHRLRQTAGQAPVVRGDLLPGMIVLIGSASQADEAASILSEMTPSEVELTTTTYRPRNMSVKRLKDLIDNTLLGPGSTLTAPARMYSDPGGGRLYVTAEVATQSAIEALLKREDTPLPDLERPLRIYRPHHRKASELLATLSQLLGESVQFTSVSESTPKEQTTAQPPGPNRPPVQPGPGQVPPMPPAQVPNEHESAQQRVALRLQGPDFVITEDEHTNSIIAIGTREFQAQLEGLIEDLDRRRPQVLIEMTLVAVTTSDGLDLGVELAEFDLGGVGLDYLVFSNFGLSSIDVNTGQRVLLPGLGGNGTLIRPDHFSAIMQALATKGFAKVISTPKLLVSDNARGVLRNVDEAPFTSVNASDTVATTSFAGFESAGTTLSVTPHISEGEHLTLEYELSFSNFTGSSSNAAVPPPRTTNSFTSIVEVPDGYAVVTGGIVVENDSDSNSRVPFIGDVPILGLLFGVNSQKNTHTRVYAFIRPTILRDDEFEQLKYITLKEQENAGILEGSPAPEADQWMR